MSNSKHGLKALVLAMMVGALGTMAFAATGAQGQAPELPGKSTTGKFTINLGPALLAAITASQIGPGFLLVLNGSNLEIQCTNLTVEEAKIDNETDALGKVVFTGCKAFSMHPLKALPCEFKELETIRASALVKPILHGNLNYVLFEPLVAGQPFTTVSFKAGECPLPLNNPVSGSVTALVDTAEAVSQLILFSPTIQLLTADVLKFGANTAYIDAHAQVELTGLPNHKGQKLGIQ